MIKEKTLKRYLLLLIAMCFMICNGLTAGKLRKHIASLLKNAPKIGKKGFTKKVPAKILNAKLGFYGLFAILKFEGQTRLGIFNMAQCKFQKMLKLKSTNFQYTCGGTLLFIFYSDLKIIELWNLQTLKKIKEQNFSIDDGFLTTFEMPPALNSKVLVSGVDSHDSRFFGILNLKTLTLNKFQRNAFWGEISTGRDLIHYRFNKNMNKTLAWCSSSSPGFVYVSLNKEPKVNAKAWKRFGALNFANNDKRIVTTNGFVLDQDAKELKRYSQCMLFPVLGADYYIQYNRKPKKGEPNLIVRSVNLHKKMAAFKTDVKIEERHFPEIDFTDDRRLLASKISHRIVLIDNKNHELRIYPLIISRKKNSLRY